MYKKDLEFDDILDIMAKINGVGKAETPLPSADKISEKSKVAKSSAKDNGRDKNSTKVSLKPKKPPRTGEKGSVSMNGYTVNSVIPAVPTKTTPAKSKGQASSLDDLWQAAAISKAKKPKEKQVWLDTDLCSQLEMLNLKHGKPSSLKHIVNGIIKMYIDEHKTK